MLSSHRLVHLSRHESAAQGLCYGLAPGGFVRMYYNQHDYKFMRMNLKSAYLWGMKARLNLTVDEHLLISIKKIAQKNNTSVSELVTDFFKKIAKPVKQKNIVDLIEELEKPSFAEDTDLKELYYKEQGGKYGF